MLPLIAFPAYFVYRIHFHRPKRYVSFGALHEVKPDVEGLAGCTTYWILSQEGDVDASLEGGVRVSHAYP